MNQQKCPVCAIALAAGKVVEPGLLGSGCSKCNGCWIPMENYWKWIELQPVQAGAANGDSPASPVDTGPAKRCPDCSHFLGHHRVGHGLTFYLDHCGTCGGFWFDAGEWDMLKSRGMHTQVHHIFSPAWQAAVAREDRAAAHEQTLRSKLGDADYDEGMRIKEWIAAHERRAELYAMILPEHTQQ